MKRILITGAGSYIGTSFEKWITQYMSSDRGVAQHKSNDSDVSQFEGYEINTVDTKDEKWREKDFSGHDVVFHVAGIAHVDNGSLLTRHSKVNKELYYKVNKDLTIEIARKAKKEGVRQFIFMSSIIVYGERYTLKKSQYITRDTVPKPTNYYGMSKLLAEKGILSLQSDDFNVVILRAPMIYGKGCKGNYPKLAKLARITPVFPDIENKRSMLYIDNLCEFVRLMIVNEEKGVFFPQNREYVSTTQVVKEIENIYNRKILFVKLFNPLIYMILKNNSYVNKVFGSLTCSLSMSKYDENYRIFSFEESIKITG